MQRAIVGFYQDEEGHWAAKLECGHGQHVRHDPPWMVREWVLDEETRAERIGRMLECKKCDEELSSPESARKVGFLTVAKL